MSTSNGLRVSKGTLVQKFEVDVDAVMQDPSRHLALDRIEDRMQVARRQTTDKPDALRVRWCQDHCVSEPSEISTKD